MSKNVLGIAEGQVRKAVRLEPWVMHNLLLAELQSSGVGPAASRSRSTALVYVLNTTERLQ